MAPSSDRWLVTGGCGFVGLPLVRVLAERGIAVRVFDDLSVGKAEELSAVVPAGAPPGAVDLVIGDVRDAPRLASAMRGISTVVHLAAQTGVLPSIAEPERDLSVNVLGTLRVLEAARDAGVRKVVFASSNAPLGGQVPASEGSVPRPLSPYGASKLAGEAYCSAFAASYGLSTTVLRFSNAYGPFCHRKGSVVALFFRRLLSGEPLVVYGDGTQTRDFVATADLVRAILAAAERGAAGSLYQVGSGVETPISDLVAKVAALARRDLGVEPVVRQEPARAGEVARSVSDVSRAGAELGFRAQVPLDAGLEETWRWLRENRALLPPGGSGAGD